MPDDLIESVSKGVTEGTLEWTKQQVLDYIKRFQNRELAFVKNSQNIELVKSERSSSEYSLLSQWVPKEPYLILALAGLALRQIADDQHRVTELTDKINSRYGASGLHIAELTQIGITRQLLNRLVELHHKPQDVTKWLVYFFEHVEDMAIFVKNTDDPAAIASVVFTRIESSAFHMMLLLGSGYTKNVLLKILREIKQNPRNYVIDARVDNIQLTAFIFTPEIKAQVTHWSDSFILS